MRDIKYFNRDAEKIVGFTIPRFNDSVSGIDVLVQIVFNHLLTTPGTDVLNKQRGGGLYSILRHSRNDRDLAILIGSAVARVKSDILAEQDYLDIPPDESLKDLSIKKITIDTATTNTEVILLIESEASEIQELKI